MKTQFLELAAVFLLLHTSPSLQAQNTAVQQVEGFDSIVFSHDQQGSGTLTRSSVDFRGQHPGGWTAPWWAPGTMTNNTLVWKTANCPEQKRTLFSFVGSSSSTPPEFSKGPRAKLFVNDRYALTFELGVKRDRSWKEGEVELRYISKRVEWPYWNAHRQFETNGNSGIYQLIVPASQITAGQSTTLKIEMLPFDAWPKVWFSVKARKDTLKPGPEALQQQVEQLQKDVARLGELTHVLATQQYQQLLDSREFQHFIIYTNGHRHVHPADLIPLKNGDLLLTTREASEHISRDGDVVMLRSRDGGKTWGERQVIGGIPDVDEREGCGIQLRDGTILVHVFVNKLYRADGQYNYSWSRDVRFGHDTLHLGTYTIASKDNGKTWSAPQYVDTKGMPFSDLEGPADAPIEMPDGSVLMPVMAYNVRGDIDNQAAVILKTVDQGKSWQHLSTVVEDPGGKQGHFQEPALVRTRTGRLVVAVRNQGPENAIWTAWSDDNGKSWTKAKPTPMIGHPPDLIQLQDGRLLCTYGYRAGRHGDPAGIRAAFSADNGETWQIDQEVQIRKDFLNGDIGYPETLQMADGRLLTVYYFNLFQRFFIGGTWWRP
jgi:sialidase-1